MKTNEKNNHQQQQQQHIVRSFDVVHRIENREQKANEMNGNIKFHYHL